MENARPKAISRPALSAPGKTIQPTILTMRHRFPRAKHRMSDTAKVSFSVIATTSRNRKPLFPFGFGLSYTTFSFSNLQVSPSQASSEGKITVSFDVTKTGQREGADVAQLYVGDPSAKVERPIKELKGFEKVRLNPGETKHISLSLDHRALA